MENPSVVFLTNFFSESTPSISSFVFWCRRNSKFPFKILILIDLFRISSIFIQNVVIWLENQAVMIAEYICIKISVDIILSLTPQSKAQGWTSKRNCELTHHLIISVFLHNSPFGSHICKSMLQQSSLGSIWITLISGQRSIL